MSDQKRLDPAREGDVDVILRSVEGELPQPVTELHRPPLDRHERHIKDTLLRMGSLIEVAIREAVEALAGHDAARAMAVIENDRHINELQHEAIDEVVNTIATQAPVARDLRFLLSLDLVAYELERIGDYAANVAKRAADLAPEPPLAGHLGLPEMGGLAADLLADTVRALVDSDADLARSVAHRDDELDRIYHRVQQDVVVLGKADPGNVERAAKLLLAAHYLERIGDRCTNIAEDVVYFATGATEDLNP
jgi:phosphate transport system protein